MKYKKVLLFPHPIYLFNIDFSWLTCYTQSTLKVFLANRNEIEIACCVSYTRQISGYREQGRGVLTKRTPF